MRRQWAFGAAVVVLSLSALSCSDERIENAWLRYRPSDSAESEWEALPQTRVHRVPLDVRAEAVRLLASDEARLLDAREVQRLVPNVVREHSERRFYLLRAVATPGDSGTYRLLIMRRQVAVTYTALSSSNDTVKSAVVVDLEFAPEQVYVEVSLAQ